MNIQLIITGNTITNNDLQFLRNTYYSAVENEEEIKKLNSFIVSKYGNNIETYPAIIIAYYAGIEALFSKHAFWITTKYKHLVKSMDLFEKAVSKESDNLEIRFMRFSILHYVPSIVGYGEERESDLNAVYNLLLNKQYLIVPKDIQIGMMKFLIDSDRLENEKVETLNKLINELAIK